VELVHGGLSCRQAAQQVFELKAYHALEHSAVAGAVKQAGIRLSTGRWRDFSGRIAKLKELAAQGYSTNEAVRLMRSSGDRISLPWVLSNCPEIFGTEKCPYCERPFVSLKLHLSRMHPAEQGKGGTTP
jgi:hypothetical protein